MTFLSLIVGSAATASCVLYMQVGGISVIDTLITPEHARKEVVYSQHKDVYNKMEAIIGISATLEVAERRVKAATWPGKVMLVAVSKERPLNDAQGAQADPCYSKTSWTNLRTIIRNGAGYGSVVTYDGQRDIVVIDKVSQSLGRDKVHYTICIETPNQKNRG